MTNNFFLKKHKEERFKHELVKNFDRNSCLVTATWFQLNLSWITIYCLVCCFWGEFEDKGHFSLINVTIPWYKSPFLSRKWLEIKVSYISKVWFYRTLGWDFIFRMKVGGGGVIIKKKCGVLPYYYHQMAKWAKCGKLKQSRKVTGLCYITIIIIYNP